MKVLYLFHRFLPEFGGGGEISNSILVEESARRNDVVVATLTTSLRPLPDSHGKVRVKRFYRPPVELAPLEILRKGNPKAAEVMAAGRLIRFIASERPDIIHSSSDMMLPILARIHRRLGIPYVCHIRAYWFRSLDEKAVAEGRIFRGSDAACADGKCDIGGVRGPLYHLYFKPVREALNGASSVIAISDWMKDVLERDGYGKVVRVYNPVDLKLKPRFDPGAKKKRFFYAGALTPMKGVPELMEAFALFRARRPGWKLRVAGMGELGSRWRKSPGVEYVGELPYDDVLSNMRDSRVCVFPSRFPEPFGRVIAEAQSVGSLVVGSDTGAMPELLRNGGITSRVEPGALASAMEKAASAGADEYERRVRASHRFVRRECSRGRMMEQVQGIYEGALK